MEAGLRPISAELKLFGRAVPAYFPEARLNEALAADAFACSVSAVCL